MSEQKAKHTPGPWQWHPGEVKLSEWKVELKRLEPNVIELDDVYPGYAECGEDLVMMIKPADARLIAAAPELLESLKEVVDLAYPHPLENKVLFAACEAAKSIISKAEGN